MRATSACLPLVFAAAVSLSACSSPVAGSATAECSAGTPCPAGRVCVDGNCREACTGGICGSGEACCNGGCVDLATSPARCGSCGHACAAGELCREGVCYESCGGAACGASETCCGVACFDLDSDATHCGSCSYGCAEGERCVRGQCGKPCAPCTTPPGACYESTGTCDAGTGTCHYPFKRQGESCDDRLACTTSDVCDGAGRCEGTATCHGGAICDTDGRCRCGPGGPFCDAVNMRCEQYGGQWGCVAEEAPEEDMSFCIRLGVACGPLDGYDNMGNQRHVEECGPCRQGSHCVSGVCRCGDATDMAWFAACRAAQAQADCVNAGGTWAPVGPFPTPRCHCPTGQGGCPCTDSVDCLGMCLSPSSPCPSYQGTCSAEGTDTLAGCWCLVGGSSTLDCFN